jgi:inosine/xanthosine triphosphatase
MRVIVGSKNPVKVGAVEEAFKKYWPECEVVGIEVESGVASQPMSELETMNGARQRAYGALKTDSGDYGVGVEGGVCELNPTSPNWSGMHGGKGRLFECAWVCIVDRNGVEGLGGGLYFELPSKIAERIKAGGELGPLMDEFTGKTNVKQGSGAIGIFAKGELDRKGAYVQIVLSALIKHVSPEWFE